MGAWGTAIFSDDTAADVRDAFRDYVGDGLSPEKATSKLKKEYASSLKDPDEAPAFWLGLATTQCNLGRLLPEVLAAAIRVIDDGTDLRRWDEDKAAQKKRQAVLDQLRLKLLSPPPAAKKVTKQYREANSWIVGQLIGYRMTNGQVCVFRVIGHHEDNGGRSAVVELLDWAGPEVPDLKTLHRCRLRPNCHPKYSDITQFLLGGTSKRGFPANRVIETDLVLKPPQRPNGFTVFLWQYLDRELHEFFGMGH